MGIRLVRGRTLTGDDRAGSPTVTVVNETLARRLWPGQDPIGRRIKQGWPEDDHAWREIVGVVADVKVDGPDMATPMQAYLPLDQESYASLMVVRTKEDPAALGGSVEQAVHAVAAELPVTRILTMEQRFGEAIASHRLAMVLLSAFAGLAVTLAGIGVYGVVSWGVSQRTSEIGLRMALGARAADIMRLIFGQGMTVALAGLAAGVAGGLALTRLMESMLFDVSPTDPATFSMTALILLAVAFVACGLPAFRASRTDPMTALRHD
jgi:putative ABC transport system permease protein